MGSAPPAPPPDEPRGEAASRAAFAALLEDVRVHVDASLATWLEPRVARAKAVSVEAGAAAESAAGLALRGGKRMRAALVGAGFVACGGASWRDVERAMVAIELLQVYLLVHDDWMDADDVRRGGPTVHVQLRERFGDRALGDAAAILAGDLASSYAQEALLETPVAPERLAAAARAYARIQVDVVTGQLAEMTAAGDHDREVPSVELVHTLKTSSYTVEGPLAVGARLAGANDARVDALARYGRPLGVAFQLRDDVLGVFGDSAATGKPVGNDVRQGKRTAVVAAARADASAARALAVAFGRADATDAEVAFAVAAMEACGARARVEARIAALLAESRAALVAMDLPADRGAAQARAWLEGAVGALGERAS